MKRNGAAAAALMYSLALAACSTTKRTATAIKPPPERLVCESLKGQRPTIPAEYRIDWSTVTSVAQAKAEHGKYVAAIRTREGLIIGYVLKAEGVNFACSNNAEWVRDFFAELPDAQP